MPRQKKRGRGRPPKAEVISPPPRTRKSHERTIKVGSPGKRLDLFNVPNATENYEGNDKEIANSPQTKKRKGRPPKKSHKQTDCETKPSTPPYGDSRNDHVQEDCEEEAKMEEEISCSHCKKEFKSQMGLKYHMGECFRFADTLSLIVHQHCNVQLIVFVRCCI
jgi:hypothetical protein